MDYILRKAIPDPAIGFCISAAPPTPVHAYRTRLKTALTTVSSTSAKFVTDLDYADDLVLLTDTIPKAQIMLDRVVVAAETVGLFVNVPKTQFIVQGCDEIPIYCYGKPLKCVKNFKYLGSWVVSTIQDFKSRKILAWQAILQMNKIWKSVDLSREFKISIFIAVIESVLLYGAETWTLTKTLVTSLDGCYTKLLRYALNIHWTSHTTNSDVYKTLPRISHRLLQRRLTFVGHCARCHQSAPQPLSDLVFFDFPDRKFRIGLVNNHALLT